MPDVALNVTWSAYSFNLFAAAVVRGYYGHQIKNSELRMQSQTAVATRTLQSAPAPRFHRIWPAAVIGFALMINVAWVALLGYGLTAIIRLMF